MTLPENAARQRTARFATITLLAALGTTTALSTARAADPPSWSHSERNDKNDRRDDRRDSRWDNNRDNDRQDRERRDREARERFARDERARIERERFDRERLERERLERERYRNSSERNHDNDNWHSDRYDNNRYDGRNDNRQNTKNGWRNLGILSGATAIYGLLKHDNTITFIGAAGALYSASRYDQDRKSQNDTDRARAAFFDQGYFERDGHRYNRREVWQNGQKYYQFCR